MLVYWGILLVAFFVLWIFLGGKTHEFIGLEPLFSYRPLPDDPLTIHPFVMNHLKGKFDGSIVKQISYPEDRSSGLSEKDNYSEDDVTKYYEECSYEKFVKNRDENNILPHIEQRKLNPSKDKKRVSEVLHMNMPMNLKSKWKYQNICCKTLEEIYKKSFTSSRPSWLKNPETGGVLEIDCYNDELKIGVEYNGIQHYRYPNVFHKTYDDFIKQVRRDQYKHKKCDENGVYLITVPYNVPENKIRDYILHYLPENVSRRKNDCDEIVDMKEDDNNIPTTMTYQEYLA